MFMRNELRVLYFGTIHLATINLEDQLDFNISRSVYR